MASRSFSTVALLLLGGLVCTSNRDLSQTLEPFSFSFVSVASDTGQFIDAMVAPDGERVPTTFRLWLARPGLASKAGDVVRGVMRRGEPGGMTYLIVMLGGAFYPPPSDPEPSGALVAIDLSRDAADSLPLAFSVRSSATRAPWLAEARLANGGRFVVTLDERTKRGEFRPVSDRGDMRVFTAIAGLFATQ